MSGVEPAGRVELIGGKDDRITVLHVRGTPYEMGYEHGRLLKDQVRRTYARIEEALPEVLLPSWLGWLPKPVSSYICNTVLNVAYGKMAPFIPPDKLEEMRGLADGSGAPLETVHRMHAFPDLSQMTCSALVAKGKATRDGHVYQLRDLDFGPELGLQERPLIIVYRPEKGNAYANIGWIGFVGVVSGMNEKGLAVSEVGIGFTPGETLAGEPMPFVLEDVLRYAGTANEAVAIVRRDPGTNAYLYFFGDRAGGAIGMLATKREKRTFAANDAPSFSWTPFKGFRPEVFPQYPDMVYMGHYEEKMTRLLKPLLGKLDAAAIRDLDREIAMPSNLHTVVYDLTAGEIWVANSTADKRACDRPYVHYSLASAWHHNP